MIEAGVVTFLSFLFLAAKIPPRYMLRILGYPLATDLVVTIGLFMLYRGTGSGIAAATFAALIFSLTISLARRVMGYIDSKQYVVGWFFEPTLDELFTEEQLKRIKIVRNE